MITRSRSLHGAARSRGSRVSAWVAGAVSALRTIAGAPNYDRYVRHLHEHHPRMVPLTREEFTQERLARRYDTPGSRCC